LIAVTGVLIAGLTAWPGLLGDYGQFVVGSVAFAAVATLSVSMLAGLTGIWSLGNAAFMAIAGYGTANLVVAGMPFELAVVATALICAVVGFTLGLFAGRFSILYFGLLTLALALTVSEIALHWASVTGGEYGLKAPALKLLGASAELSSAHMTSLAVVLTTIAFLLADVFMLGARRRKWLAIKSQRTAATALGLRPQLENAVAFAVNAAIAGLAGVGVMVSLGHLDAAAFNLDAGVRLVVATVVGGAGSALGALVGAVFIVGVPELAREASWASSFLFGISTILVLLFLRSGIVPTLAGMLIKRRAESTEEKPRERLQNRHLAELVARYMIPSKDALTIEEVTVKFGGLTALNKVSLTIPPGKAIGLIGPNGAGKSTLLNAINGFYTPTSCTRLAFGGRDLISMTPPQRADAGLGRTFQHAELFDELTLREIILLALEQGARRRREHGRPALDPQQAAAEILDGLALSKYADAFPRELPFGIQKVADLGRAVALGSSFVSMDEPFSGMDQDERCDVSEIIQGMTKAGISVLLIDHDVDAVLKLVERVTVLEFGQVLLEGQPEEIRQHPEVMRAYFGAEVDCGQRTVRPSVSNAEPALSLRNVHHRYAGVLALHDITLDVRPGEFLAVLGVNGSGKSTLSCVASGVLKPAKGTIGLFGRTAEAGGGSSFVGEGVILVPEGRRLFGQLSVAENLKLGAYGQPNRVIAERLAKVVKLMPQRVQENLKRAAATFSGGEQQIIAIGRALMAEPKVLLVDEPSLGLAPILINRVYEILAQLHREHGVAVVVFEQLATHAMSYANRVIVLEQGRVFFEGLAHEERTVQALRDGYLGTKSQPTGVEPVDTYQTHDVPPTGVVGASAVPA
jgi:ABC-type branched-subunit amino acid transport system ATPase component/ABC-type branched-subunit amino acid transport system permease subunit